MPSATRWNHAAGTGTGATPTDVAVVDPTARPTSAPTAVATPTSTPEPTATPVPAPTFGPTGLTEVATVSRIVDGDTIRVVLDGRDVPLRYIGIDTPEPDSDDPLVKSMADAATAANAALVEGRQVVLARDVSETDRFGRLLRYVWLETGDGWMLINERLVELGFAQASSYAPDVSMDDVFRAAETSARAGGVGLWAPVPTPTPKPTPTPVPTPAPTPAPFTSDASLTVRVGERTRFEGRMGSYTWSALRFPIRR